MNLPIVLFATPPGGGAPEKIEPQPAFRTIAGALEWAQLWHRSPENMKRPERLRYGVQCKQGLLMVFRISSAGMVHLGARKAIVRRTAVMGDTTVNREIRARQRAKGR